MKAQYLIGAAIFGSSQAVATAVEAQSMRDATAAEIATSLRTRASAPGVLATLTQARGPKPVQLLDEIADTLVAVATGLKGSDALAFAARRQAVLVLVNAARGESGIVGAARAVPYAGAQARLRRVVAAGGEVGVRGAALTALVTSTRGAEHVPFLEQLVLTRSAVAFVAVELLGNDTGPEGVAVARRLYRDASITDELVRRALSSIAHAKGW